MAATWKITFRRGGAVVELPEGLLRCDNGILFPIFQNPDRGAKKGLYPDIQATTPCAPCLVNEAPRSKA
jgi:hypothetical protein